VRNISDISDTLSASIPITSFPSSVDVRHESLEEPGSPFSTSMSSHDMNQLTQHRKISTSYRFISLQISKSQKYFSYTPVTVAPLATHLPVSYTTWRDIAMFWGAFHTQRYISTAGYDELRWTFVSKKRVIHFYFQLSHVLSEAKWRLCVVADFCVHSFDCVEEVRGLEECDIHRAGEG